MGGSAPIPIGIRLGARLLLPVGDATGTNARTRLGLLPHR